jgi:YbgC/YbaW family acyl-CoA thioester hydrolase
MEGKINEHCSPFVYRRTVIWRDTDAARIVYTGRFLDFALEAIEAMLRLRIGVDWYRLNVDEGLGAPFVNVALDFFRPVTPRDELDIEVTVECVGASSVSYRIDGRIADTNKTAFAASATAVFIDNQTNKPVPIPERYRKPFRLEAARVARPDTPVSSLDAGPAF